MTGLLFDIGGTNTRVSLTREGRRFVKPIIYPTPKRFDRGIAQLREAATTLAKGRRITAVVGGIAGSLHQQRGALVTSPLRGWVGRPFRRSLQRLFQAPVTIENDSALVGLGETTRGAGRGYPIVAYITVSTGVGGVRIVNGRIDANALGFEPGHHIIDVHGPRCYQCGHRGDLQSLIGGRVLERRFGRPPYEIRDPKIWREEARLLALGLVNVSIFWSPNVIVLGGSMFKKVGISVSQVRQFLRHYLKVLAHAPTVVRGTLGDVGGLYGALELLKQTKLRAG